MTYLVVYQISGERFTPACGNYEHTFNGKPMLGDIRELEGELLEMVKQEYGDGYGKLSVVITGLFPLGW